MVCKKHYDDGEACAACEKDKTIRDLRAEYNRFVDAVHDQMPPLERELAEARAECERLREALRFYATGDWNDNYPGGVRFKCGEDTCLDFGNTARAALDRRNRPAKVEP